MRNGPTRACACIQSLLKVKSPFPEAAIILYYYITVCLLRHACVNSLIRCVFGGQSFCCPKKHR